MSTDGQHNHAPVQSGVTAPSGPPATPSRRRFLGALGTIAASSALAQSMAGALPAEAAPAWKGLSTAAPRPRNGMSVVVIGAGVAGLSAARQLLSQGYTVRVLEALDRPGGRNLTARRGTVVTENAGSGTVSTQVCDFDDGLYLNLGPGRIPFHHQRVIGFCRENGVALEPYVMETTANLWAGGFDGVAQPNARVANDTRGHLAALLHRAISKGKLDHELALLDPSQKDRLLDLVVKFGDLDPRGRFAYTGSTRAGYRRPPQVTSPEITPPPPVPLTELVDAEFWGHQFYNPIERLWQPTLFQPVGGMDRIVDALVGALPEDVVSYSSPVTGIRILDDGVEVTARRPGGPVSEKFDYCLSNMPIPVLQGVAKEGFTDEFLRAIDFVEFDPSCKVGWQANQRFWENETYQIFGGISWTDDVIRQIWYPSYDYFTDKGTLTGAYNFDADAVKLGDLSVTERLRTARESAKRLHPEFEDEQVVPDEKGISIAWHKVPYQAGVSVHWNPDDPTAATVYRTFLAPDRGRFYVLGDQVSPLPGWQEGALMSAEYVVQKVLGIEAREAPVVRRAPDSRALRP